MTTHLLVSVFASLAVFHVGATTAWAQIGLEPDQPASVAADDRSAWYGATVTTDYDFDFWLRVYHNSRLKHNTTDAVSNNGPSVYYKKRVSFRNWGLQAGDRLDFLGRATITEGPYQGQYDEQNWVVYVSEPHARLEPATDRMNRLAFTDREPPSALREEVA